MSIAYIDADIIVHASVHSASNVMDWGDGVAFTVSYDRNGARKNARDMVASWYDGSGAKEFALAFSDHEENFRTSVMPWYKKVRRSQPRPESIMEMEEYLIDHYSSDIMSPGLEADDVLGLHAHESGAIMVSVDKDMKTVPGWWYNPRDGELGPQHVRPEDALYNWMTQTITGDRVDEYLGAPGAGAAKARKVLDPLDGSMDIEAYWDAVVGVYEEQLGNKRWSEKFHYDDPEREALVNAQVARILRDGDYDFDTQEVRLWKP